MASTVLKNSLSFLKNFGELAITVSDRFDGQSALNDGIKDQTRRAGDNLV